MVFSVGFLRLISLLVSTALTALTTFLRQMIPLPPLLMTGIDFLISFVAIAVLFGLILKYVPEATIDWKEVRIGALFTALLFTLGKSLLGLYLGKSNSRYRLRSGRFAGGDGDLDLLLSSNLLLRRRIYSCICASPCGVAYWSGLLQGHINGLVR